MIAGLPVGADPGHDTEIEVNLVAQGTPVANLPLT